jgi:hypothetical protein
MPLLYNKPTIVHVLLLCMVVALCGTVPYLMFYRAGPTSQDAKPGVNPGFTPRICYIKGRVNPGLNPGFGVLRFGLRYRYPVAHWILRCFISGSFSTHFAAMQERTYSAFSEHAGQQLLYKSRSSLISLLFFF